MRSLSYRAYDDPKYLGINASNRCSDERPLVLNCTGTHISSARVNTFNAQGRDDYYLLYIVSGQLTVSLGDTETHVSQKGDLWVFPPHTKYKYSHVSGEELEYMYVHFSGSQVEDILSECGIKKHPAVNRTKDEGDIYLRFRSIFDAFTTHDSLRDRELSALLERLLISLGRSILRQDSKIPALKRSIAYLNSSYDTRITVPELAKMENLSVSRFSTLFKTVMGVPPLEYVTQLRISTACALLSTTDLSVCDVSLSVGYSDPHFFSRVFKKITGLSPAEFKKRERS